MDELIVSSRPELRQPLLVAAFRGWNDGGQGASLAGGYLAKAWEAERFAEIAPDGFFDFQAVRPHVSLVEGVTRRIDWPENAFFHASIPGLDRDAVLLLGIEPNMRWRTFASLTVELARSLGVELVVTLGSLLADVPHTRPAPVTAAATDPAVMERLGLEPSRYEGPTGIVGVLNDACTREGLPSVGLWAAVPHYLSLAPSPRAALALCERLGQLIGCEIETTELVEAVDAYNEQVSEAVAADSETAAYVEELEQRSDVFEQNLPSGETLAAELTRFLREREEKGKDDEPGSKPPADE
ncbi:MAG TPA: PAC2 family protein [Gaiellaceae bacterium]|jgi:predicted ATP-grasp superfamily ATP-dependent carboligase